MPDAYAKVSTCVSHDAVNSADTKDTKGFIVTGIGAVDDIRHDFKRPTATGDLQKGERFVAAACTSEDSADDLVCRYINMDFLVYFSTIYILQVLLWVFLSYDIACQYWINFFQCMTAHFPQAWSVNLERVNFRFLVPKFHLPAHITSCHWRYSFNFMRSVGRTEGEAPERGWPALNRLASTTKEMGPGARRDTMDEHMGDSNWQKVVDMGEFN
jgi:hypothetical protein